MNHLCQIDNLIKKIRRLPNVKSCLREEYFVTVTGTTATICVIADIDHAAIKHKIQKLIEMNPKLHLISNIQREGKDLVFSVICSKQCRGHGQVIIDIINSMYNIA